MDFFSNDPKADTIKRVRGEISEVRSVMVDNIDKARSHLHFKLPLCNRRLCGWHAFIL